MDYSYLLRPPLPTAQGPKVTVTWVTLDRQSQDWSQVLYLYQTPDSPIAYIGKAYRETVAQRWQAHVNEGMITRAIAQPRPITVLVGIVRPETGRLTESLVSDVEALLIRETNPPSNTVHATVEREGLEVTCAGFWPISQSVFTNSPLPHTLADLLLRSRV